MKNALAYSVNNNKWNKTYLNQMINSINSFYHHNPRKLLKTMRVFIMTDDKEGLDLSKLNPEVKYTILELKDTTCDYSKLEVHMAHLKYHTYFRFELFVNPKFKTYDNILYMDCDTEFTMSVEELFKEKDKPTICVVEENENWLKKNHGISTKHYFNSGVMLLTPKLMDKELKQELYDRFLDATKNNKFLYADQDAINLVLDNDKYQGLMDFIYPGYNSFVGTYINGCPPSIQKIIHHAGLPEHKLYKLSYL